MTGPYRPFDPSELRAPGVSDPSSAELADALGAARDLEALAASDGIRPTDGFDDRVMAAIALEPIPRAVVSGGSAVRGGPIASVLFTVRNAWRVGTTGGRPFAVRAQALAFVLIVAVAAGSLAGAGAIAVAGLFDGESAPAPSVVPVPSVQPTPDVQPTATPTPTPSPSPTATMSAEPTETAEPTKTPKPGETARPTRTPRPTETPRPGQTAEPTDDHGGGGGPGSDGGGSGGGPGPG